jgi:hypothetical protein
VTGFSTPPASYDWLADLGMGLGIAGSLNTIVGTYYGLKAQQNTLKQEASNAEFAANQANIQSRAAEREADLIIRAGMQEAAYRGAQAAMDVATSRARAGASGIEVDTGSSAEYQRAIRLASEVDKRTIRTNAERRAAATREAGANLRASSLLGRASAANLRATAGSISPAAGAAGAGLSQSGSLIGQYLSYYGRR